MRGLLDMPASKKAKRKKAPSCKCNAKACRNRVAVRVSGPRAGKRYGAKCWKHRMESWRANQPMRAAYLRLKHHAKDRGIPFTISFRHFECFAKKSELVGQQGLTGDALTVDRRDNLKGYVVGNLQVMTRAKNTEKQNRHDAIRKRAGYSWNGGEAPDMELPDEPLPDDWQE